MAHLHVIEDANGDVEDQVVFCCDFCHETWCMRVGHPAYQGWNGCNEIGTTEPCAECHDLVHGVNGEDN